jgi:spore coat protein U-like protein
MKTVAKVLAVAAFGAVAAGSAQAQTATTTFQVLANVQSACTVAATNLDFGNYNVAAAATTTSTINVTCTNGETYGIDLGGSETARTMSGPLGSTLNYGMFTDNTYTTGFSYPATAFTGNGASQAYIVYGRIPASQFAARSGAHSATVTVTVTY